jgi:hypothetical protein
MHQNFQAQPSLTYQASNPEGVGQADTGKDFFSFNVSLKA